MSKYHLGRRLGARAARPIRKPLHTGRSRGMSAGAGPRVAAGARTDRSALRDENLQYLATVRRGEDSDVGSLQYAFHGLQIAPAVEDVDARPPSEILL